MKSPPLVLLLPLLALAACQSGRDDTAPAPAAAAPQASQPAVPQLSGENIARFDLVDGATGALFGTYAPTAPGAATWTGPHPVTGEPVQWSVTGTDARGIGLSTESEPPLSLVVRSDTDEVIIINRLGQRAANLRLARVEFQ